MKRKNINMKHAMSILVLSLAAFAPVRAEESPSAPRWPARPKYPVKMADMTDAEFGRMFFAEINLDHPDMRAVKPLVAADNFPEALAAWGKVFVHRCRTLPLANLPRVNYYSLDLLMNRDGVMMQHGNVVKNFGPPGQMDWYGLKDWCLHVNMMWHPSSLLQALEQNARAAQGNGKPSKYTTEEMLIRWRDVWRDFVNNNWRIGMPYAYDPKVRDAALAKAGLKAIPSEWASTVAFRQQLVVEWQISNWFINMQHASRAVPKEFDRLVPPRVLAEMTYFMVVWPLSNLLDEGRLTPEQLAGGAPNQNQEKMSQFLRLGLLAPEFYRAANLSKTADAAIRIIVGGPGWENPRNDHQKDGSGTELSFNYMKSLVIAGEDWLAIAKAYPAPPDWVPRVREAVEQRAKFMANLETPTGLQVLCKGTHRRTTPSPQPHSGYTSIAFPYHGLYMMRSDWSRDALFLSLHNPRRGQGHEANDGNKLMLEAFGRPLLIANSGEGEWQSRNQTFMLVDGLEQVRTFAPVHGAYGEHQSGRWHSSPAFDFAESTYTYGWGSVVKRRPGQPWGTIRPPAGQPWAKVNDVAHLRQAIFVKEAGLWFLVDIMRAPDSATHIYQQVWCFDHGLSENCVSGNDVAGTISTSEPRKPNLLILQASPGAIHYRKHYAEGNLAGQDTVALDDLTLPAYGWQSLAAGEHKGEMVPAVTMYAEWEGKGRQTILSVLVPSPTEESPLASQERIVTADRVGLKVKLTDGRSVSCYAARSEQGFSLNNKTVHLAVATEKPEEDEHGLLLDAPNTTGAEYVRHATTIDWIAPVRVPAGFRWVNKGLGEVPEYFEQ